MLHSISIQMHLVSSAMVLIFKAHGSGRIGYPISLTWIFSGNNCMPSLWQQSHGAIDGVAKDPFPL